MSRDPRYQKLLNSPQWARVKAYVDLRAGHLCERCKREGFITPGKDHHHIRPVEAAINVEGPDGMRERCYDVNNVELLCVNCHIKTHQEMRSHTKESVAESKARRRRRFMEANDPNFNPDAPPE